MCLKMVVSMYVPSGGGCGGGGGGSGGGGGGVVVGGGGDGDVVVLESNIRWKKVKVVMRMHVCVIYRR